MLVSSALRAGTLLARTLVFLSTKFDRVGPHELAEVEVVAQLTEVLRVPDVGHRSGVPGCLVPPLFLQDPEHHAKVGLLPPLGPTFTVDPYTGQRAQSE